MRDSTSGRAHLGALLSPARNYRSTFNLGNGDYRNVSEWSSLSDLMPDLAVRLARNGSVPGLIPAWERGVGEHIARNARPTRLSGNTLWVHASTLQWERELRARDKEILERLARVLGEGVIRQLAFD